MRKLLVILAFLALLPLGGSAQTPGAQPDFCITSSSQTDNYNELCLSVTGTGGTIGITNHGTATGSLTVMGGGGISLNGMSLTSVCGTTPGTRKLVATVTDGTSATPITIADNLQGGVLACETTLDPAFLGTGLSLDAGQLVVTKSGSGYANTRTTTTRSTGKVYFEATPIVSGGGDNAPLGLSNASASANGAYGADFNSVAVYGASRAWFINNVAGATLANGYASGVTLGVAIDFDAKLIWLRVINEPAIWNDGGTADPTTGIGGEDFSAVTGPYHIFVGLAQPTSWSVNLGQQPFQLPAPTGFGFF